MLQILIFFLLIGTIPASNGENGECKIKVDAKDKYAYVYFEKFYWTHPKHKFGSATTISNGTFIQFECQKGFQNDDLIDKSYTFQCVNGLFNKSLEIQDVLCRSSYHIKTQTFQISPTQFGSKLLKCDQNGWKAIQVKTEQPGGKSKLLYTVCFDTTTMRAKFSFQPRRNEKLEKTNVTRSDVWGLDQFGMNTLQKVQLTEGYVPKIQKQRITKQYPDKYNFKHPYPYEFNRGHLAPYADFGKIEDKKASCLYINIAPQWREFNGNSWSLIEKEVRSIVEPEPNNWEIYTGVYSSLPTTKGPLVVSPTFDKNGAYLKSYVPVPKLFWKILYNVWDKTKSKVFVGINNPELKSPDQFTDKYVICKPIPDKNGKKFQGSEFKGFVYNCRMEEFLEKLKAEEKIVK